MQRSQTGSVVSPISPILRFDGDKQSSISFVLADTDPDKYYTVAVFQTRNKKSHLVQLLTNVRRDLVDQPDTPYPLSDARGSPNGRRVFVEVYEQQGILPTSSDVPRDSFSLSEFVREHGLRLLDSRSFLYTSRARSKAQYFHHIGLLSEEDKKYCRCVLHVAAKNTRQCNKTRKWGDRTLGSGCYNPYAVCRARLEGSTVRFCGLFYEWENIPTDELRAYADLQNLSVADRASREDLLEAIRGMKERELGAGTKSSRRSASPRSANPGY